MNCKNCDGRLITDAKYCSYCGARVIHNRLTIKNLWSDFSERFLNLENYLFRTFWDLFKKPEAVIGGYVSGIRKRYIYPAGYFTFAVTLIGFTFFIQRKFFNERWEELFVKYNTSSDNNPASKAILETTSEVTLGILEYQSLILLLTIPVLAIISKIVFYNYKNYNFSEHLVIHIYAYSHYSIVISLIQMSVLWSSTLFPITLYLSAVFQTIYYIYALKRVFQLNFKQILLKTLLFIGVMVVLYILLSILMVVGVFLFTDTYEKIIDSVKNAQKTTFVPMLVKQWALVSFT